MHIKKPEIIETFENLYDKKTGGYHFPKKWYIPRQLEDLSSEQAVSLRQSIKNSNEPNLSFAPIEQEVAHLFYWLVRMVGATSILETGTNLGYSSSLFACGVRDNGGGNVYTIDVNKNAFLWENTTLEKYITFIKGSSLDVELPTKSFDMLFLDSDHSYDTILKEVIRFDPMLKIGGLCIFHDTFFFDGIGLCVNQLMKTNRYEVLNINSPRIGQKIKRCPGVTIARKILSSNENDITLDPKYSGIEKNIVPERAHSSIPWIDENHPLKK